MDVSGSCEITLLSLDQAKPITEAALVLVLFGLFIQGFALVPMARKMNLTLSVEDTVPFIAS